MTPLWGQHGFGARGEGAVTGLSLCEIVSIRITHIFFLLVQLGSAGGSTHLPKDSLSLQLFLGFLPGQKRFGRFLSSLLLHSPKLQLGIYIFVGAPQRCIWFSTRAGEEVVRRWWFPLFVCKEKCKHLGLSKGRVRRKAVINIVITAETSS